MRGIYCLLIHLPADQVITVGALGRKVFKQGCYVYVGSAMGGVEQRLSRHWSAKKKVRWHIDYLLAKAEILASVAMQAGSRAAECETVQSLSGCEDVSFPIPHFGSSGCRCESHLLYFGDSDPSMVMEMLTMRLSMSKFAYPRSIS